MEKDTPAALIRMVLVFFLFFFFFTVLDTSAVLEITVINYIVLTRIAIIIIIIVVTTDLIENSIIIKSSDYFPRPTFLPTRSCRKKIGRERMLRLQVGLITLTLHACLHAYQGRAVLHFPRSFLIHSYFMPRPACLRYSSFVILYSMILLAYISMTLHMM